MSNTPILKKPILRGYFHQEAFFIAVGACTLLMLRASDQLTLLASAIYSFGLFFLFGTSAIYHRPHWEVKQRTFLKRIDHSAIFVSIAGTFTPLCLLALKGESGNRLLLAVWFAAFLGVLQSIFWVKAPRWLTAILYVSLGCFSLPYLGELKNALGTQSILLTIMGGVVYAVGAVFYALKKPRLNPNVFGYHELFHVFTVIGVALHFAVIYPLIH